MFKDNNKRYQDDIFIRIQGVYNSVVVVSLLLTLNIFHIFF